MQKPLDEWETGERLFRNGRFWSRTPAEARNSIMAQTPLIAAALDYSEGYYHTVRDCVRNWDHEGERIAFYRTVWVPLGGDKVAIRKMRRFERRSANTFQPITEMIAKAK